MTLEFLLTVQSFVRCHQCGGSWSDYEELQLVLSKLQPPKKKVEDTSESMQDNLTRTNEPNLDSVRRTLTKVIFKTQVILHIQ